MLCAHFAIDFPSLPTASGCFLNFFKHVVHIYAPTLQGKNRLMKWILFVPPQVANCPLAYSRDCCQRRAPTSSLRSSNSWLSFEANGWLALAAMLRSPKLLPPTCHQLATNGWPLHRAAPEDAGWYLLPTASLPLPPTTWRTSCTH